MGKWSRNKADEQKINGGNEYTKKDNLSIDSLNAVVNNSFYGVDFVEGFTETPDVSGANVVGTPEVLLIPYEKDGKVFYKFKFLNLKGQKGDKGDKGDTGETGLQGLQGERGLSALVYDGSIKEVFEPVYGDIFNALPDHFTREVVSGDLALFLWNILGDSNKSYVVIGRYTGNTSNESLVFKIEEVMETTGKQGETGLEALTFNETLTQSKDPTINDNMSAELKYFNRTPITDDTFIVTYVNNETNVSFLVQGKITNVGDAIADYTIINVNRLTGEQGTAGATFTYDETTRTLTINTTE